MQFHRITRTGVCRLFEWGRESVVAGGVEECVVRWWRVEGGGRGRRRMGMEVGGGRWSGEWEQ